MEQGFLKIPDKLRRLGALASAGNGALTECGTTTTGVEDERVMHK